MLAFRSLASGAALATVLALAGPASAQQTFDATNRGWFSSLGRHTATNLNTLAGQGTGTERFAVFFVFDLTTLAQPAGGATLRLELESVQGPDVSESFGVYDVTTPIDDVLATWTTRTDIYSDLGSGVYYGFGAGSTAEVGSVLEIPLEPDAVDAINAAAGGRFAVGVNIETLRLARGSEGLRFSLAAESRVHQLVLTEAPAAPSVLSLAPAHGFHVPPADHAVTATVVDDDGVPTAGAVVGFEVVSGPHTGLMDSLATSGDGTVSFSYNGSGKGVDRILATHTDAGGHPLDAEAKVAWDVDCNANQVPDTCDLACGGFAGECAAYASCGSSVDADANGEPDECFVAPPPPPPPPDDPPPPLPPPANTAPDCSTVVATPALLHRPDRRFRSVVVGGATDPDGDTVAISVDDVFQDERADGRGSSCPDVMGDQDGDNSVKLRAERREYGDGRVYHLDFTADDGNGGVCSGSVTVCVPDFDRRGRPRCVDQGAVYDSTTCQPRRHHHHRGCGHRHWHRGHGH